MSSQKVPSTAVTANSTFTPFSPEQIGFNPLEHPIVLTLPRRLAPMSAWHEHIPFAMYLVSRWQPSVIVELGTHRGDSYCAFCQAVQELHLDTRCFAVDTWQGDAQSGFYGPEVLDELRAFHDPLYGGFSQLIQTSFAAALGYFADGSIDLLHLDGYHTYEAARADLLPWFAKLSPRGVILLHDINVHERDFGVWRLWEELVPHYPHFEFYHGHGLGVLAVGPAAAQALGDLFGASAQAAQLIRSFFYRLGRGLNASASTSMEFQHLTQGMQVQQAELARAQADRAEQDQLIQALKAELNQLKPLWDSERLALNTRMESERLAHNTGTAALQRTLDEQTKHLDALGTRIQRMATRETELRTLYLDAQAELMERDRELDGLTSATSPLSHQNATLEFLDGEVTNLRGIVAARDEGIAWLRSELALAQAEISTMRGTRIWRLREHVRKAFGAKA